MTEFDELWPGGPRLARCASFGLGTDSVLLADFVSAPRAKRIADLGCGCGALSVALAARYGSAELTGIESQPQFAELCRASFEANGFSGRCRCICGELRDRSLIPAGWADVVVSNPPYFPVRGGHSSPDEARRIAREELCCTPADVCPAAAAICRWDGSFFMVHRPERLSEICCASSAAGLEPKRLRMVQYNHSCAPNLVLMEFRRGAKPGLDVMPPLVLTDSDGAESAESRRIYHREG